MDFSCDDADDPACTGPDVLRSDLVGALLTEALPGELGTLLFEQCIEAIGTGEPLSFDDLRTTDRPDGAVAHYDIRAVAVGDRICLSWREVSERFRIKEALAGSRNRSRLLAENSSDAVVLVDSAGVVEWVSASVRDMLGREPEEMVGCPRTEFVHPDDHLRRLSVHRHPSKVHALSDGVRYRRAGGGFLWVSSRLHDVLGDDGRLVNVVMSTRDVHKHVPAREALVSSEERYRLRAENVSDVAYHVLDDRIVWISPSVERVLGWRPADVVGRSSYDLRAPEDHERADAARSMVVSDVPLEHFECRYLTPSGGRRWMRGARPSGRCRPGKVRARRRLQDVHEGHANRLALASLAAVNAALVGATDESRLLDDVCRLVVDEGGFDAARPGSGSGTTPPAPVGRVAVALPVVVAGQVATLAEASDRPLVAEIAEHVEIESHAAVRAAVRDRAGVRLSVDDAGAGYAGLRHILELLSEFAEIDIGLVRNIDSDPARQALGAGPRHRAHQTGTTLIAEGVEDVAERDVLLHLGVPLTQGYLFGRQGRHRPQSWWAPRPPALRRRGHPVAGRTRVSGR